MTMVGVTELLKREIEMLEERQNSKSVSQIEGEDIAIKVLLSTYKRELVILESLDDSNLDLSGTLEEVKERYKNKRLIAFSDKDYNEFIKRYAFYDSVMKAMNEVKGYIKE